MKRAPITRQRSQWEQVEQLDHELLPWPTSWRQASTSLYMTRRSTSTSILRQESHRDR